MMGSGFTVKKLPDSQGMAIQKTGYFPDREVFFSHVIP